MTTPNTGSSSASSTSDDSAVTGTVDNGASASNDAERALSDPNDAERHREAHGDDAPPAPPAGAVDRARTTPFVASSIGEDVTHVAVPTERLSAWRRMLNVIERGESLAAHELEDFVGSIEHALRIGNRPTDGSTSTPPSA